MKKLLLSLIGVCLLQICNGQTFVMQPGSSTFSLGTSSDAVANILLSQFNLQSSTVMSTNYYFDMTNIYVTGSSVSAENGHYTLKSTNSGTTRAIWTNTTGRCINRLIPSDPNYFDPLSLLYEIDLAVNPIDGNYLYGAGQDYFGGISGTVSDGSFTTFSTTVFDINAGIGGSSIIAYWGTNQQVIASSIVTLSTNTLIQAASPGTSIIVDPVYGNDAFGSRGGIPFKSLNAVAGYARSGDNIYLRPGIYTNSIRRFDMPQGTTLFGNGVTLTYTININDNCSVYDLIITNGIIGSLSTLSNIVVQNVTTYGTGDSFLPGGNINGLARFVNCHFFGNWDTFLFGTSSNALVTLENCGFIIDNNGNTHTTGMHGPEWIPSGESGGNVGGKVRIFGGYVSILNPTNVPFVTNTIQGNACIMIGRGGLLGSPTATNFGNASMEIYGMVLMHGTTNSGASVAAIRNGLGVPVSGWYVDNTLGNSAFATNSTNGLVFLSSVQGSTNMHGSILQTNFVSGQIYTNLYGSPIEINANVSFTTAAVSGTAKMDLRVTGQVTNTVGLNTLVTSLVQTVTNTITAFVPTNTIYTFTNTSSGTGNSSTVVGGQILIQ